MPSQICVSQTNKRYLNNPDDEVLVKKTFRSSISIADLIHEALDCSQSGMLSLTEIYDFISEKYSSKDSSSSSWRNSIRQSLSMQSCFHKIDRPSGRPGKGFLWASDRSLDKTGISVSHRMPPIVKSEISKSGPEVHSWSGDIWVPNVKEESLSVEIPLNLVVIYTIFNKRRIL